MASSPPPSTAAGVPPSGNGKYIAIAILLLLGVGAAIVWKVTQKPSEVVEKLDAAPPPPPSGRKITDDDIPLPPEVPDAAAEDAGKKVVTNNGGGDNGCGCAVKGTSTPELESAIQMRARQAHACYDQALAADSTLKGKVTVSLKIGAGGQVCSASGQPSADLTNPSVAPCIAAKFRGNSFPAPKGGCVDIALPVNLTTAR